MLHRLPLMAKSFAATGVFRGANRRRHGFHLIDFVTPMSPNGSFARLEIGFRPHLLLHRQCSN
jgi:hypothetical protein